MATGTIQKNMVLLWTNPNPTSTFTGQTLTLDLSKYGYVLIESAANATNQNVQAHDFGICVIGKNTILQMIMNGTDGQSSALRLISRSITVSTTGIVFGDGYGKNTDSKDPTAAIIENQRIVPLYIWGIKA